MYIYFGGSFNPPTRAHYLIVKTILRKYKDAKVIVSPVGLNYQKESLQYDLHRYKMLTILFEKEIKERKVIVSDYELYDKEFQGTYKVLKHFEKEYDSSVSLLIGMDNFLRLKDWMNYQKLKEEFNIIVFYRKEVLVIDEDDEDDDSFLVFEDNLNRITFHRLYKSSISAFASSSRVRRSWFYKFLFLTRKVRKYIDQNKLY